MAHYALLNMQNVVTDVIVGKDETDGNTNWELFYQDIYKQVCKRTSYNGNIRKNFAGVGYTYDESKNAFIAPKPYDSWTLNESTCQWEAPSASPGGDNYTWDEGNQQWTQLT